jgi:hypothetical protein
MYPSPSGEGFFFMEVMMKLILAVIVVLFSINVARAEVCLDKEIIAAAIALAGERPILRDKKQSYILTLNRETGSWSLIQVRGRSQVCMMAQGTDMEELE